MAERAEATLGMSSLDRLRELKEETERRQAGGRRRVVDLPVTEVHPDPRQVRSDFVADVLSAEDQEHLEGLARNIAAIGIHNPIHVRPDSEGGYVPSLEQVASWACDYAAAFLHEWKRRDPHTAEPDGLPADVELEATP